MDESVEPLLKHEPHSYKADGSVQCKGYSSINAVDPQFCYVGPPTVYDEVISHSSEPEQQGPRSHDHTICEQSDNVKVYKVRWYILILYSVLGWTQGGTWNTFGPISSTCENAFGWDDSTIALLNNWGPITYLVSGIFFSWMMDVKGLRLACIVTAFCVALGTSLRCITMDSPAVTWLAHCGQIMNGFAGPVTMAGAPVISAIWFPTHQRTTATAIAATSFGTALAFIIGPLLVPDVPRNSSNSTNLNGYTSFYIPRNNSFHQYENHQTLSRVSNGIADEKKAIHVYMYIGAGWSIALFLLILIYFPKKPPLPPCASAAIQRENFLVGLKHLMRRPQFWLVAVMYGVSLGVLTNWSSLLDVMLKPHNIDEKEAGWIGFYSTFSAGVVSMVVARFADVFSRILKWFIFILYLIGTAVFIVFTLATMNYIPTSTALVYTTIIVGMTVINAAVPLIFELGCELAYPTGEGTTNGVLTIANNIAGVIFLFILMDPHIGTMWMNWALIGSVGICLPLLLFMKEQYNRMEIDERNPNLENINNEIVIQPPEGSSVSVTPREFNQLKDPVVF